MSIKKAISLSFILLANTIILAHAIVAHHHDGMFKMAVAIHHEHEHDCDSDDAQPVDSCNDPFCHGDISNCVLSSFCMSVGDDKPVIPIHDFDFNLLPCLLTAFTGCAIPPIIEDIGLPFRQKPCFYNTDYISQSFGLRAPPVC